MDENIVIVGGGISGLHFAYLLEQNGYNNITILEKNSMLGGKIHSCEVNGKYHEIGACYISPQYKALINLCEKLDIVKDISKVPSRISIIDGKNMSFEQFILYEIRKRNSRYRIYPDILLKLKIYFQTKKYEKLHEQIFGEKYNYNTQILPPYPNSKTLQLYSMSILTFLETNKLELLIPILYLIQTCQGYGYLDKIPAYYVLLWLTPLTMKVLAGQLSNSKSSEIDLRSDPVMFKNGFASIISAIEEKLQRTSIIYNCDIVSINRVTKKILLANGSSKDFDKLVISAPKKNIFPLLTALSSIENEFVNHIKYCHFHVSVVKHETKSKIPIKTYFDSCYSPNNSFIMTERFSNLINFEQGEDDIGTIYQYSPNNSNIFDKKLQEYLDSNDEILFSKTWDYFPHFESNNMLIPYEMRNKQGQNNTYYIGSDMIFESVDAVIDYNLMLINNFIANTTTTSITHSVKYPLKPFINTALHTEVKYIVGISSILVLFYLYNKRKFNILFP